MGTVRLCDLTKRKIKKGEQVYKLSVDGEDFEICEEAKDILLKKLQDEDDDDPSVSNQSLDDMIYGGPIVEETKDAPFDQAPAQSQAAIDDPEAVTGVSLPDNPGRKLGVPRKEIRDQIIQQSQKFESGSLDSINDRKARENAERRLKQLEERMDRQYKSKYSSEDGPIRISNRYNQM